jgi:hypothetical protein
MLLEIVNGGLAKAPGQMQQPHVPDDCPSDVWQLIQSCLASQPAVRPTAKVCLYIRHSLPLYHMAVAEISDRCSTC